MVLGHTYRAYIHIEVRYQGRRMWGELSRGFASLDKEEFAEFFTPERLQPLRALARQIPPGLEPVRDEHV